MASRRASMSRRKSGWPAKIGNKTASDRPRMVKAASTSIRVKPAAFGRLAARLVMQNDLSREPIDLDADAGLRAADLNGSAGRRACRKKGDQPRAFRCLSILGRGEF